MEEGVRDVIGADATRFLDATPHRHGAARRLAGTNIFLLGYAYQMGLIPVSRAGAVPRHRDQRRRGRRPTSAPSSGAASRATIPRGVEQHAQARADARRQRPLIVAGPGRRHCAARRFPHRLSGRAARAALSGAGRSRADARVARRRAAARRLTEAVARNYFKLLAIKDEYEVARLYTDGEFERAGRRGLRRRLQAALSLRAAAVGQAGQGHRRAGQAQLRRMDAPGACACSRSSSGVRGTLLDPFGHTEERRLERRLIGDYERTMTMIESGFGPTISRWRWSSRACPATIRGYGHVKRRNIEAARAREKALAREFRNPAKDRVALAA